MSADADVTVTNETINPAGDAPAEPRVLVLMGVSGSGKSTVASLLAERMGWEFEEGDSLHPQSNIDKMAAGHPLTDEDRWPWLELIAEWIEAQLDAGRSGVITCSSLKRSYRDVIDRRHHGVEFVYLAGSEDTISDRLAARTDHFMPPSLLTSQFETLEEPSADEPAIRVDDGATPSAIVDEIQRRLHLHDSIKGNAA
ncbi:gluconokinase [Glaciihabitans sp. dw_435]|uniref:gluconokinase n=1 Tax=Glaciihabitans sp. dw_435 TaxID=2720081 RepID=UPI001BD3F36E|nr:gluconokinase [Glaciihabitans sp. dw_435]